MAGDELLLQLEEIRTRAQQLVSGIAPDQLTRRAEPAKWSIAECLTHLNLTAAAVQPKIAAAIEKGKKQNITGTGPFSRGLLGNLLIWMAEPPLKFRLRAPKIITPNLGSCNPSQVITDFMQVQDGWEKLIRDAEQLDQNRIKVMTFRGLPPLRISGAIPWMLAHERRHLLQAENVKREIMQQASVANA